MGPIIQGVALDTKEIIESSTPLDVARIVLGRFIKECPPPETFVFEKCVQFLGTIVVSISTGGNLLFVSGVMSAPGSIIK